MKLLFRLSIAIMILVIIPFTINAEEEKKKDKDKEEEEREVIVNYEVILQGTYSGRKDSIAQVITTQEELEKIWKQHISVLVPQPPAPEIDFETHVLAVIYAGEKNSGGYAVVVKEVKAELDDVVLKYRLTAPQPNSFNIQVITQPFAMIKIEKPKGTVRLVQL